MKPFSGQILEGTFFILVMVGANWILWFIIYTTSLVFINWNWCHFQLQVFLGNCCIKCSWRMIKRSQCIILKFINYLLQACFVSVLNHLKRRVLDLMKIHGLIDVTTTTEHFIGKGLSFFQRSHLITLKEGNEKRKLGISVRRLLSRRRTWSLLWSTKDGGSTIRKLFLGKKHRSNRATRLEWIFSP